ncbi:MAG: hypothetical protein HKP36_14305 [Myxococcales bacterium]|nr:FUSC family protein [Deltaproteobacteria bacterium]NNL25613.1 hypothetical protein [Myxococcales bacterium]
MSRKAKEAFKTGLAMTLAYWIALSAGWEKPMWAGFAVGLVSLGTIGQSFDKASLRMLGTLMAAVVSFALLGCFPQERWLFMLSLSLWVGYCTYRMGGSRYPYFWQVSAFVTAIVSLEAGFNASNAFRVATLRIQETGLGILVYSLVALFVWPVNAGPKMRATARELTETQAQLLRALVDAIRGGHAEPARTLRTSVYQQQTTLCALLDAAETDSIEVHERRTLWRAFRRNIEALTEAMERCGVAIFGQEKLDAEPLMPSLASFEEEITKRLAATVDLLGGQSPGFVPTTVHLPRPPGKSTAVSHFQRAALTAATGELVEIERLTRELYETVATIRDLMEAQPVPRPPQPSGFVYDPERFLAVARVMLMQWMAYLLFIYVNDLPGGVGFVILVTSLGITASNMPQVSMLNLLVPGLVSTTVAGVVYVFVMPRLSSFVGLGGLLFTMTFMICYLFASPKQALGRTLGLILFVTIASISNEQSYDFLTVANTGLMLPLVFGLITVASYVPVYLRADRMVMRLLRRFFASSEHAVVALANLAEEPGTARGRHKRAFHTHELASLPSKIDAWKPSIDVQMLPGNTAQGLQPLVDSVAGLSRAIKTLVERAQAGHPQAIVDALGEEVGAWQLELRQVLESLAEDPTLGRSDVAQQKLVEITARLEARIESALVGGEASPLSAEEEERFYLLLAAYRSVSHALASYVTRAAAIDWTPWHEERFA